MMSTPMRLGSPIKEVIEDKAMSAFSQNRLMSRKELPLVNQSMKNMSLTSRELPDLVIKKHMDVRDLLSKHRNRDSKRGISTGVNKANRELAD
jgi:hypothetical protein